jgi:hypothetical protein
VPRRFVIPIFVLLSSASSYADYHYVSNSGSRTYPYSSWETATEIIDSAIYASSPYDTIFIGTGNYNQIVYQRIQDTCLTFIGSGMYSTIISPDSINMIWFAEKNTTIEDLGFQNNHDRVDFGVTDDYSRVTVRRCYFHYGWGIQASGDSTIVEDCHFDEARGAVDVFNRNHLVFRNNYGYKYQGGQCWLFAPDLKSALIENNILVVDWGNTAMWFNYEGTTVGESVVMRNNLIYQAAWGPIWADVRNVDITNNIIMKARYQPLMRVYALRVVCNIDSVNMRIENNVFADCPNGVRLELWHHESSHADLSYNCFWNIPGFVISSDTMNIDSTGNLFAYPTFANPDSFNFHLQAYSPLIDAGDPNILDVDGSRSDIGVFGGPGGSSYEYQDLPPRKPDSLISHIYGDTLLVRWRTNQEADFYRYIVWRDTLPGFVPSAFNIVSEPYYSLFYDMFWDRQHNYYYRVASYDMQWNLSDISNELAVINVAINEDNVGVEKPSITAIESNYPNPFNSSTTIVYTVANLGPIPAQINIDIYDIGGRKVRELLDVRMELGRHAINWDGRDDSGNELASGVYFAKITQWHVDYLSKSQKLLLMR